MLDHAKGLVKIECWLISYYSYKEEETITVYGLVEKR